MIFVQKVRNFVLLVFVKNWPNQSVLWPCGEQTSHLRLKKTSFKKVENLAFLQFFVLIRSFFHLVFWKDNLKWSIFWPCRSKSSHLILKKNIDSESRKCGIFPKRVSPWFFVKNWKFCLFFFFGKIVQNELFCQLVNRNLAIKDWKKHIFNEWKLLHFSKGV